MAPTHPSQPGLSEVQGRALVALARKTLLAHFGRSPSGSQDRPLENIIAVMKCSPTSPSGA
jgi:hypothetical protein